jgi:hypothetical protein
MKMLRLTGTTQGRALEFLCRHRLPSAHHPELEGVFDVSLLVACIQCMSDRLTDLHDRPIPSISEGLRHDRPQNGDQRG